MAFVQVKDRLELLAWHPTATTLRCGRTRVAGGPMSGPGPLVSCFTARRAGFCFGGGPPHLPEQGLYWGARGAMIHFFDVCPLGGSRSHLPAQGILGGSRSEDSLLRRGSLGGSRSLSPDRRTERYGRTRVVRGV